MVHSFRATDGTIRISTNSEFADQLTRALLAIAQEAVRFDQTVYVNALAEVARGAGLEIAARLLREQGRLSLFIVLA